MLGSVFLSHLFLDPVNVTEYLGVEAVSVTTPEAPGHDARGHPGITTAVPNCKNTPTVPLAGVLLYGRIPSTEHGLRKDIITLFRLEPSLARLSASYRQTDKPEIISYPIFCYPEAADITHEALIIEGLIVWETDGEEVGAQRDTVFQL